MQYRFHLFLQLFFAGCFCYLQAQVVPMFQMPLFFEDAIGNKDTLVVGYDTSRMAYNFNAQFDGAPLYDPLDSVFEVRVFHLDDDVKTQASKKIISHFETWDSSTDCGISVYSKIVVSCKYPPIKISYDSTLLAPDGCRSNTIISPDLLMFFIQFWWNADLYYCMGSSSSITDSLNFQGQKLWIEAEVEGKGITNLPGLFMVFRDWGPCTDPTLLAAKSASALSMTLSVSPNPVQQCADLTFATEHAGIYKLEVLNLSGTVLQSQNLAVVSGKNTQELDLAMLPAGIYVVRLSDGKRTGGVKVIKH